MAKGDNKVRLSDSMGLGLVWGADGSLKSGTPEQATRMERLRAAR